VENNLGEAMNLYVLQYQGVSFISRLIEVFTWSRFSHSALANTDGCIIEAWEHEGIAWESLPWNNHKPGTVIQVYKLKCTSMQAARIWEQGMSLVGGEYDFVSIFGFLPLTRFWWKNDPDKFFCSHYVAHCCKEGGVPLFSQETPLYKLSPGVLPWSPKLTWCTTIKDEEDWGTFLRIEEMKNA
jgi:hypothetical protein